MDGAADAAGATDPANAEGAVEAGSAGGPLTTLVAEGAPSPAPSPLDLGSVTIQGKSGSYSTLADAVAAAEDGDTLVVSGDLTSDQVNITKDLTIVAGESGAKVLFSGDRGLVLDSGKNLVLGNGSTQDLLTLSIEQAPTSAMLNGLYTVEVANGHLLLRDGVLVQTIIPRVGFALNAASVYLNGPQASGDIEGGQATMDTYQNSVSAGIAVNVAHGAHMGEISGGAFTSSLQSLEVYDGSTLDTISGGVFKSISHNENVGARFNVYVENDSTVNLISGGTFVTEVADGVTVTDNTSFTALAVLWGGRVNTISGGTFVIPTQYSYNDPGRRIAVVVMQESYNGHYASIGTISGGTFIGPIGLYVGKFSGTPDRDVVEQITGGTFSAGDATHPLANGKVGYGGFLGYASIGSISGGDFSSVNGDGFKQIGGEIRSISGGTFTSGGQFATGAYNGLNQTNGTIDQISGGRFHGARNGVRSAGTINTISGGVFWGDTNTAVWELNPISVEPGLEGSGRVYGDARFKGADAVSAGDLQGAFNQNHPPVLPTPYHVSVGTTAVDGVGDGFHYLTIQATLDYDANGGQGVMDRVSEEGLQPVTVEENGFTRDGYEFTGWNTMADGSGQAFAPGDVFLLRGNMTLYAQWEKPGVPEEPVKPTPSEPTNPGTPTTPSAPGAPTPTVEQASMPAQGAQPVVAEAGQAPATSDGAGRMAVAMGAIAAGVASLLATLGLRGKHQRRRGMRR